MLIYDIEVKTPIAYHPKHGYPRLVSQTQQALNENVRGWKYATGFDDHESLKISVVGVYQPGLPMPYIAFVDLPRQAITEALYQEVLSHLPQEFQYSVWIAPLSIFNEQGYSNQDDVFSFNGITFDDQVCRKNGLEITTSYDLLRELFAANGLDPFPKDKAAYKNPVYGGCGLDALAQVNLGIGKSGHGAKAPILWLQGQYAAVIAYCIRDVWLTKQLVDRRHDLIHPVTHKPIALPAKPAIVNLKIQPVTAN